MEYFELGGSGLRVSRVALGTWGLGGGSVWSDHDSTVKEAEDLISACLDHGINYLDTAPVYGTGVSEELIGKAIRGRRSELVIQTKCSLNWRGEGGNFHYERDGYTVNNDTRPEAIRRDAEDSLRRLGTDRIDSLIVHYVCPTFPVEETVGALEELVKEGKILTYGLSNSQPGDLDEYMATPHASAGVSLVQEFFSILSPFHGREYFPVCAKHGACFQTYGVLEEGFLTSPEFMERQFKKSDIRSRIPWTAEEKKAGLRRAFAVWEEIRAAHGCTFAQLAEAWALSQFGQMSLLVGMRRRETVADTARCLDVRLSNEELELMEDAARPIQEKVLDK